MKCTVCELKYNKSGLKKRSVQRIIPTMERQVGTHKFAQQTKKLIFTALNSLGEQSSIYINNWQPIAYKVNRPSLDAKLHTHSIWLASQMITLRSVNNFTYVIQRDEKKREGGQREARGQAKKDN